MKIEILDRREPSTPTVEPGFIGDFTQQLSGTWKSSIRGTGGYWQASAIFKGDDWEKIEFFTDGLMREVKASMNSGVFWRGFVSALKITYPSGDVYERNWDRIYNKVQAIYSKIGDNMLTNGSAETSAWADYGTPTSNTQSTAWVTNRTYSNYTQGAGVNEGAIIQASIAITAATEYQARVSVKIVSGSWELQAYRVDTGENIATAGYSDTGEAVISLYINSDNEYTGNIGLRLACTQAVGEIYADAAVFQIAPCRAETSWYTDATSQMVYGTREIALLYGGMATDAAEGRCQTELRKNAYPRTLPPTQFGGAEARMQNGLKLEVFFSGYVFTLTNQYAIDLTQDEISTKLSTLITESEWISAGFMETNTQEYQIDDLAPVTLWSAIQDIIRTGDSSGNRYEGGVYDDLQFGYKKSDTSATYIRKNGRIYDSGMVEVEPWLLLPGYVLLMDAPISPAEVSGYETDDPRVVYMSEIEFDNAAYEAGGNGITWTIEERTD